MTSIKLSLSGKVIYWLFVLLACLGVIEITLQVWNFSAVYRLQGVGLGSATTTLNFVLDRELLYRIHPDPKAGINSLGFRDREFTPSGAGDRLTLVVGDSFPMGLAVASNKTFPKQLESLTGGPVYNLGVQGYGPDQALLTLERFGMALAPKTVIFALYPANDLNDIIKNELFTAPDGDLNPIHPNPVERISPFFKTPQLMRALFYRRYLPERVESDLDRILFQDRGLEPQDPRVERSLDILRAITRRAIAVSRAADARLLFVIIPSYQGVLADRSVQGDKLAFEQAVAKLLTEEGATALDLTGPFVEHRQEGLYNESDWHLSEHGHNFVAERLHQALSTNELSQAGPAAPVQTQELRVSVGIGWIGPLSGGGSVLGVDSAEVLKMVFSDRARELREAGVEVSLFFEDDQYEASKTLSAFKKLVAVNHVKVAFVLTHGGMLATADAAEREGVILINPLDCDEGLAALPPNSFCIAKTTESVGETLAAELATRSPGPTAIFFHQFDPFGPKVASTTLNRLRERGIDVVLYEGFERDQDTFLPYLVKVKGKVRNIVAIGGDTMGMLFKQAHDLGLTTNFYTLASAASTGFKQLAAGYDNGAIAIGWYAPRSISLDQFLSRYRGANGRAPYIEIGSIPTFDSAQLLVDAIINAARDSKAEISIQSIRDYLLQVKGYQGLSGTITIDSDGAVRTLRAKSYRIEKEGMVKLE